MIGHKRIEGCEGGIEKAVRDLTGEFARRGHSVTVYDRKVLFSAVGKGSADSGKVSVSSENEKVSVSSENAGSVRIVRVPTLPGAAEVPLYSALAALHAAFSRCDIAMFHASGPCRMIPLAKLGRKKIVAFIHGLDSTSSKWGGYASHYLRRGERLAAKSADALLLLSENISSFFKKNYGRAGTLVFNGITPPGPDTEDRAVLKAAGLEAGEYFLWVGRLSPEKRVDDLADAYMMSGVGKTLYLAGNVDESNTYYRMLAEKSAGCKGPGRIVFGGFKRPDELEALYRNACAFILPSQQEGMPYALLEALSCGALCILSDLQECRALAQDHALYFRTGDRAALCDIIKNTAADSQLRGKLTAGESEEILEKFSLEKSADRILDICARVLNGEHV